MNKVEKDKFVRAQLDCAVSHKRLKIGNKVHVNLPDNSNGFDATLTLQEVNGKPIVVLDVAEWANITILEASWEGYTFEVIEGGEKND